MRVATLFLAALDLLFGAWVVGFAGISNRWAVLDTLHDAGFGIMVLVPALAALVLAILGRTPRVALTLCVLPIVGVSLLAVLVRFVMAS